MSQIKSRRMLTMDCGDPDSMVIGSAGTLKANISKQCCIEPLCGITYKVTIKGLICSNTYNELFDKTLQSEPIHGCVEAGIVPFAIPNMDIVGIAPKSRGAHTTNEHLYLESMQPFWEYLVGLLKNICTES